MAALQVVKQQLKHLFVYRRGLRGDIETWTYTREQALNVLHAHGFSSVKLKDIIDMGDGIPVNQITGR